MHDPMEVETLVAAYDRVVKSRTLEDSPISPASPDFPHTPDVQETEALTDIGWGLNLWYSITRPMNPT